MPKEEEQLSKQLLLHDCLMKSFMINKVAILLHLGHLLPVQFATTSLFDVFLTFLICDALHDLVPFAQ